MPNPSETVIEINQAPVPDVTGRELTVAGQGGDTDCSDALAGRPWSRVDLAVAGAVSLLTMLLAWICRSEIITSDPWHYGMAAVQFPQSSWVPLGYTRYGMILPLAPLVFAFGDAPATFYLPAILASGVLTACVYLLGRRWWGHVAGITAVVLLLSNWIVFTNLSRYYPDVPSMALVLAALTLAVAARGRMLSGARWSVPLVLATGFLLGWSFEARETALFAWPAVIAALWVRGKVVRNAILSALPVLLWAAVDVGISAWAYGDPLLKLHTFTRQDLSTAPNPADIAMMNQLVGRPRIEYLTMIPRFVLDRGLPGGVWVLVLASVAALAVFVRHAAVRVTAVAFIASYILFVGISGFFVPSHPAGRLDVQRYWIQFVPWIALAVAGCLHVLVRSVLTSARVRSRELALAVVAVLFVAGPVVTVTGAAASAPTLAPNGGAPMAGISAELARLKPPKGASLFTDWQSARVLPVYQRPWFGGAKQWRLTVRSITGARQPRPGDYALIVSSDPTPCGFCTDALAPWRKSHPTPPTTWTRVFSSPNQGYVLYAVR